LRKKALALTVMLSTSVTITGVVTTATVVAGEHNTRHIRTTVIQREENEMSDETNGLELTVLPFTCCKGEIYKTQNGRIFIAMEDNEWVEFVEKDGEMILATDASQS
jgi:hypothetical protein